MNVLSPGACGATRWHQRIQTCAERHGGQSTLTTTNELSFAVSQMDTHYLCTQRVLYKTKVKERYSTICRHACFGVQRLMSVAWYMS